ncbi:MAG: GerMN domain-containing protein [Actinomycetota bacterium]|nr:GerMN domain-containing protein [Actinomycetota bacterium]
MRSLRRLGVLVVCALALSGCTLVSTSSSPSLISPNDVPLGLLDPTIPFTDFAQVHFVTRQIYLVDHSQHVVAVNRLVTSPPTLSEVLHYVPLGPTANEQANGITTEIPSTMVVNQANMPNDDGIALVDVSGALLQLTPNARRLAVAQLLFTAQAMGADTGIKISINQIPFTLQLTNGSNVTLITPAELDYLRQR